MKDVKGYEGYYKVDSFGNVYSLPRNGTIKKVRLLKNHITNSGYLQTALQKNGDYKQRSVHRIVAIAFIENESNKKFVNHINGIKTDNRVENLEWVTRSENEKHAYKTGLKNAKYDNAPYRKISKIQSEEIRELCKTMKQKDISKIYGITQSNVSKIKCFVSW